MASKTDSTKIMWRVQVRKSRNHAWRNCGLFETRSGARLVAGMCRDFVTLNNAGAQQGPYGFGNTRVLRYVRGGGR